MLLALALAVSVTSAIGSEGRDEAEREASAPKLWKLLQQEQPVPSPEVIGATRHDTSQALRNIPPAFPGEKPEEAPENPGRQVAPVQMPSFFDPTLQTVAAEAPMPSLNTSFEGVGNINGVLPPDTNGDVSATQYVQTVNLSFAVYSKTGAVLLSPRSTNTLFSGFGGACQNTNNGDPIVQYDQLANRWLITQFALPNFPNGPFSQCIAISTTSDATGAYYRYEFQISTNRMNDYPKFGVWPDGYYASFNDFLNGQSYVGATVIAFERNKMLLGQAAQAVKFVLGTAFYSMLPSDLDGTTLPPAGAPNTFVQVDDNAWGYPQDQLEAWKFHVDWATPANSTFTLDGMPATSNFTQLSAGIPQPSTTVRLDTLGDRLMYRLAYRNFADHQALVVNHTVSVSSNGTGPAAVRWYELRSTGGSWSIFQQGTYGPADGLNRWMGSVAMDKVGDLALGMSVGSSTVFPSINYAGRLAGDPPGMLPMESRMTTGSGSQTHSAARWGDYSSMSLDPVDDCTFWYTTEYLTTTGSAPWRTRIGSFTFPGCSGPSALTITTASLPGGTVNQAYSQPVTATGGTTPYGWSVVSGSLPPGLSLSPTGTPSATISGTPTTAGSYNFTVQVTDAVSATDTQALSITVAPASTGAPQFGSAGAPAEALATSINVPYPSGIAANDTLLLLVMTRDNSDIATPTGFSQGDARTQNSTLRAEWFWKRATGSESGTLTVSKASGSALLFGRMYRYTGVVSSGTPFEAAAQTGAGSNTTMTPVDITTLGANRRVVVLVAEGDDLALGNFSGGTATVPEETAEATTATGTDGALGVNGLARPSPGLFDFGSYTLSAAVSHIEFTFALIPA